MQKIVFIQYPKCGTCQKASKWLKENCIEVENRNIVERNPNEQELSLWIERSALPINKFFNTSGKVYKEQNVKDIVKMASRDELVKLLATNGMLVKRPIIVAEDFVLVGFNAEEWAKRLK